MLKACCLVLTLSLFLASNQLALPKEESASPTVPKSDSTASGKIKIVFTSSEPLGLLRFISGISKQSDEGQSYYDFFLLHHKLNKHDIFMIRRYVRFRRAKTEFAVASGRKLNLHQQLMALACNTKSFDEFFKSAKQYCDEDEYETLQLVMNHFRPLYEQIIWKPFLPQLNKDLAWFRDNESAFARPLETVATLFQSSAGREYPLKAALVPVPTEVKKEGNGYHFITSALSENLDSSVVLSVGIVPPDTVAGFNDLRVNNNCTLEDNDNLIHEFVHCLWAFRNQEFRKSLLAVFQKSGRQFNYDLLNESQAAAIQAWFYEQVHGKEKRGRWYDNQYVDKYAKALLPVLREYVNSSSSSHVLSAEDYAQKAMQSFDTTFPNWHEDPQIVLWRSQIVQSPSSEENLADSLNDEMFDFSGGDHKVSLVKGDTWPNKASNCAKNPELTTIFLLHPNQIDVLQKYFGLEPKITDALQTLLQNQKDTDSPVVKMMKSGQQTFVFSISNRQKLQKQGLLDYAKKSSIL